MTDRLWRFQRPSMSWIYVEDGKYILGCVRLKGVHAEATVYPPGGMPEQISTEGRVDEAKRAVERWWHEKRAPPG
jgi:hypothetical protein